MNCNHCGTPLPENSRFCLSCGVDQSSPGSGPRTTTSTTDLTARLAAALEGRYRITKMVGRGGMGAVFLAEDLTLERPVAIKVLPPDVAHDDNLVGRFQREARTAARLDHPNIIPIFAVESVDDLHFFVMKFVAGDSLDEVLKAGAVTIDQAQGYLWEAAVALGHAHRRGVVHRDIKPANIMLDHDGRVVLTDFGISKAMQAATQLTGTGQVIGTPHYMSPEQARGGEIDGRSDQYSLAVLGFQMVTGRLPFEDSSIHALIFKHVSEDPPLIRDLNPAVPPFLATALHRALAKDPADRYATMEEFAQAVCPDRRLSTPTTIPADAGRRSLASDAVTEIADTTSAVTGAFRRPHRGRRVAGILLLLAAGGGGGYAAWTTGLLDSWLGNDQAPAPTNPALIAATPAKAVDDSLDQGGAATTAAGSETNPEPDAGTSPSASTVADTQRTTQPAPAVNRPTARSQRQPPPPRVAAVPRTGFLTIDAIPWGTVYVDDVELGDTPLVRYEVQAGRHVIRIVRNEDCAVVDTVQVSAGGNLRRNIPLPCGAS